MLKPLAPPFVLVLAGATTALGACDGKHQPPITTPKNSAATTPQTAAPLDKGKLRSWKEVGSGHPEGATNPPSPMLVVSTDGRCFKQWYNGKMGLPKGARRATVAGQGYVLRVLSTAEPRQERGMGPAVPIVCPEGTQSTVQQTSAPSAVPDSSASVPK